MIKRTLTTLAELGKIRITSAVTLSTLLGYVLFKREFDTGVIIPSLGIFILAMASATINHYQEREIDKRMDRTKDRPIPSGRISAGMALLYALILTILGALTLYLNSGFLAMQLGLLALLWYNAIYTPLKRITPFAVVPGSFIGAIPPMVGWVAAGGDITDPTILIVSLFFFIWQIPHFWLLLMKYGNDYHQAGFPSLTNVYSSDQLKKITFVWTITTAIIALFIPIFGTMYKEFWKFMLLITSTLIIVLFIPLLIKREETGWQKKYFIYINSFLLVVMILLSVDAVS
ncbi:MAG: protoheme IX farnesyltransferase [Sphingobacteriia bacterium]|nr:protoheme IX farnesyltransferase [Sphingobacteriia bacterium]